MTSEAIEIWVERYVHAWDSNDPAEIGVPFTEDALYYMTPYAEPWRGREQIVTGWLDRKDEPGDHDFRFEVLAVADRLGFVRGWTRYLSPPGEYANLCVIRLVLGGRCLTRPRAMGISGTGKWDEDDGLARHPMTKGDPMLDLSTAKDRHVDQRLRAEPIVWLATTRPDGRPHNVPVWFWWDGETVLIFSQPNAQKVRNLRHSPHAVLTLNTLDDGEDVVIVEGVAELLDEPTEELMLPAFGEKYAELFVRIGSSPAKMATEYSQPIRVRPRKFVAWHAE
ncbi:MAG: hypothetical protein QOF73_5326 [Thermomicrobiales bacterium]|jgi:PPOX class probable F420-dependent enzyme|nr:hypothetical protein [Thermomicrobiales bacterium]